MTAGWVPTLPISLSRGRRLALSEPLVKPANQLLTRNGDGRRVAGLRMAGQCASELAELLDVARAWSR
jgi:hypothetical protein